MGFFSTLLGFSENKKTGIKEEINIMDAINAHIKWKIRLDKFVDGTSEETLDPKIICRDDQCVLGKWIHGPAQKHFQDDDGLKVLRDHHAEFHVIAANIVTSMQNNEKEAAEKLLKGVYMGASQKVVRDLTELNKQLI